MPIRIAPGTFAGGTRFVDIALPMAAKALAGMFEGKRIGEQVTYERQQAEEAKAEARAEKERKQALADLAGLIELHGPEAVKQPGFGDLYRKIYGRDWPTVPVMKTEEVEPEVPAVPGTPARVMQVPGTSPAERGPGGARPVEAPTDVTIPGREPVPGRPAVTRQVQVGEQPAPLGGALANITPRQLGMEGLVPPKLLDVPLPQLKALGFDIDVLFKGAKAQSSDHIVAEAMQAFREGRATPADLAILELKFGDRGSAAKTPEGYAVERLRAVGGDMNHLREVDPYAFAVLQKAAMATGEKGVLFSVPGPNGQSIPIKGMDDLKALLTAGIININQLPPIARNMLNLDKEGSAKGIPAGTISTTINQAGIEAAKILGVYTIAGTWAWQSEEGTPERAAEVKKWEDLRDKIFRERISRIKATMDSTGGVGSEPEAGYDEDDPTGAGPIALDGSLQYIVNNPTAGGVKVKVTSTTSDQHIANSNHYRGLAIDVVPEIPLNQWDKVIADYKRRGYKVIDERKRPAGAAGKHWAGPHLHIEPGPGMRRRGRNLDTAARVNIVEGAKAGVAWGDIEADMKKAGFSPEAVATARKVYDGVRSLPPTTRGQSAPTEFNPALKRLFGIPATAKRVK